MNRAGAAPVPGIHDAAAPATALEIRSHTPSPRSRSAEPSAQPLRLSVGRFIESIEDDGVRVDCLALIGMMRSVTGCAPEIWGVSLVGFGAYPRMSGGAERAEGPLMGFTPLAGGVALHLAGGPDPYAVEIAALGSATVIQDQVRLGSLKKADAAALDTLLRACMRYATDRYYPSRAA